MRKQVVALGFILLSLLSACQAKSSSIMSETQSLVYTYSSWGCLLEYVSLDITTMQAETFKATAEDGKTYRRTCVEDLTDEYIVHDLTQIVGINNLLAFIDSNKQDISIKKQTGSEPTDLPYWSFRIVNTDGTSIQYQETTFYTKTKIAEIIAKIHKYIE